MWQAFISWYIWKLQLGWHPVAAVQYTFTHEKYAEQHKETEYNTYITIKYIDIKIRIK